MGLRETIGGKIEQLINDRIDEFKADDIKAQLHKKLDDLIDDNFEQLKHRLKADVVDLIDGQDDIQS